MKDICPELIKNINDEFEKNCIKDANMRALVKKVEAGTATYADAYKYAEAVGTARANAFQSEISSEVLPDGKMYYNIAERVMTGSLGTDHEMIADFAEQVQKAINDNAGIRLKAQRADLDEDRIDGFVQRLASEDNVDNVKWLLNEPVKTHARSVVDDTVKKNAKFQHKAGIKAKVVRYGGSDCCKWCDGLTGEYIYPSVPREVFMRHDNCRCSLDYNGKKLTAYESGGVAHTFRDQGEAEKRNQRIEFSEKYNQDYKKVERDPDKKYSAQTKGETITSTAIKGSRNEIYLSDNASVKPKELHRIENQIDKAKELTRLSDVNCPKFVIIGDSELQPKTVGRFDAGSNTIFIKPTIDKNKQQYVLVHESYHAKDFQDFINKGGIYTDQNTYIDSQKISSKVILEQIGVDIYNVGEISSYAKDMYEIGRFDEVLTEYRTVNAIGRWE